MLIENIMDGAVMMKRRRVATEATSLFTDN